MRRHHGRRTTSNQRRPARRHRRRPRRCPSCGARAYDAAPMSSPTFPPGPRVGLVTALLPPAVGGTEILMWRLFHGGPETAIVAGARVGDMTPDGVYGPLDGPRLDVPYPRLRGYRYGLFPLLGALAAGWVATT